MKNFSIKVVIACVIVAGVSTGGYYGYKSYKASKTTAATTSQYISMRATKTNLQLKVQGTGSVFAGTSRDITNGSIGQIKDLSINVGDRVTKDSALFTISNDSLQQAIDKAQNTLDKQKLQLSNAKNTLATANETLANAKTAEANATANTSTTNQQDAQSTGSSTQNTSTLKALSVADAQVAVDKAKLEVSTAELAVKDAERELTSAKTAKNSATVKSPIDGMVIAKNKHTGDSVPANTAILTVIDTNSLKVKVSVDELDIQKVKTGQKAEISIGAIKGKTYEGTVEQIALTGTASNNVTTYDVTVSINNPENIKLGMNATVNILIESKENVVVIPTEALTERNGKKYVMMPNIDSSATPAPQESAVQGATGAKGNRQTNAQQPQDSSSSSITNTGTQSSSIKQNSQTRQSAGKLVEIKTGLETENYIEVLEGITEGQQVLVSLPQTSTTTTTNNKNNISGFPGGAAGLNGANGGGNRQAPTGATPKN